MKLYPPSIEGKLPACAGGSLVIPFTMNRAVSEDSVSRMTAIIKTISTGRTIATLTQGTLVKNETGYTANFSNETENGQIAKLNIGQYYKVQIAYVNGADVGYYSPVGTFKRTTMPQVKIPALENNFYNGYEYTGTYDQSQGDSTEKIYSYCFELRDSAGNLVDTSGTQIHNSENDRDTEKTQDTWKSNIEMIKDNPYYITYKVTTMNGLTASSPRYTTMNQDSIDIDLDIELQSQLNPVEGCIELRIAPSKAKDIVISGSFVLVRASSKNNFASWDEVYKFSYLNTSLSKRDPILLWEDCTVEQGEEYLYALQAYNSRNLYSNRMNAKNGKVKVDFEDAFLYDGKRQLKIRFNPKISSFKNNVLETKTDTLGSKYPFIFRNGYVHYKEFQISGLISLLSDESGKFMSVETVADPNATRLATPSKNMSVNDLKTNLSAENIYNERQFKLEVLEWLNNGEAKIFRSPAEGNYIVRLMNVSLTPNDTLGRMLHTFQCTAYEIAEWNFKNLVEAHLIELPENSTSNLKIGQIQPRKMINMFQESKSKFQDEYPMFTVEPTYMKRISFGKGAYGVNITEATPGTIIGLIFAQGNITQPLVEIEIGGTGAYYVLQREYPLTAFQIVSGNWDDLKVTFEYYDDTPTDAFSNIANMTMTDEIRRLIGPGYELNIPAKGQYSSTNNIVSDIRREVGSFHYIRAEKRFIQEMWPVVVQGKNMYSRNQVGNDLIYDKDWNPAVIYHNKETDKYYNYDYKAKGLKLLYSRDENGQQSNKPDFRFRLNSPTENVYVDLGGRPVDAQDEVSFGASFGRIDALRNVGPVDILQIGNGVIADVAYRVRTKEYVVESEDAETIAAKKAWMTAQADIEACITKHQSMSAIENAINFAHDKYEEFIQVLKTALKRKGVEV
jgi:hypothetical protein